ncbi:hypothetical protein D3C75_1181510 [compost metagenome]
MQLADLFFPAAASPAAMAEKLSTPTITTITLTNFIAHSSQQIVIIFFPAKPPGRLPRRRLPFLSNKYAHGSD